jgi:imidazolonepropionase-like amidohydrolase
MSCYLIKADYMFDSKTGDFKRNVVVTVEEDTIAKVEACGTATHDAAKLVDLPGCTLLPGFIDSHDHLSLSPQLKNAAQLMSDPDPVLTLRGVINMRTDLAAGITTSRCLGEKNFIDIHLKNAVNDGVIEGPRIITGTRGIKASHGHGVVGTAFDGVDAVRDAVRENIRRGADFIKIFATDTARTSEFLPSYLSPVEIRIAVDEAHRSGKAVAAHSVGGEGLTNCIEQGVDVIEHAYFASDPQLDSIAKKNRWVVLTPSVFFDEHRFANMAPSVATIRRNNRQEIAGIYRKILKSGIKVAIGTDASHGRLVEDVIFLVGVLEGRLTECLQGITSKAAELTSCDGIIGSIAPGKKADLVAVIGDVGRDVRCLRNLCFVMKNGLTYVNQSVPIHQPACGDGYDYKGALAAGA